MARRAGSHATVLHVAVRGLVALICGGAVVWAPLAAAVPGAAPPVPVAGPQPDAAPLLIASSPAGERRFTVGQLRALPAVRYRTVQPQLGRAHLYQGVLLSVLARELGVHGQNLRIGAVDRFEATVQASDYTRYPIMLAYDVDGRPGTFENKGPLQIVFPTHAYPKRFPRVIYGSQWVWYVNSLRPVP